MSYSKFFGSIAWQIMVLTVIIQAIHYANITAISLITWYVIAIAIVTILTILLIIMPDHIFQKFVAEQKDQIKEQVSPAGMLTNYFSHLVTVIEIVLFVMYGWYLLAVIWSIGAIAQEKFSRRMKKAIKTVK